MTTSTKCKRCRELLFDEAEVAKFLDAHSERPVDFCGKENCASLEEIICVSEENLPDWIKSIVEAKQWSRGKINCKRCGGRVGSFDFISGTKCACKSHVLPPVHLIRSKVDLGRVHS